MTAINQKDLPVYKTIKNNISIPDFRPIMNSRWLPYLSEEKYKAILKRAIKLTNYAIKQTNPKKYAKVISKLTQNRQINQCKKYQQIIENDQDDLIEERFFDQNNPFEFKVINDEVMQNQSNNQTNKILMRKTRTPINLKPYLVGYLPRNRR